MPRNRFVSPEIVRLPLSDGDWIDVKKRLNTGETRNVFARQIKTMNLGEPATLDLGQVGRARVVEYLLGWSFVDADGRPVPYSEPAINNLDPDTFAEIVEAIDAHAERVELEIAAVKNSQAGALAPAAT